MISHRSGRRKDLNPPVTLFIYHTSRFFQVFHKAASACQPQCSTSLHLHVTPKTSTTVQLYRQKQCMGATVQQLVTAHDMNSSLGVWSFTPLVTDFSANILPNIAFWNVSNGTSEYQIQLAWPLNWSTPLENVTVETM